MLDRLRSSVRDYTPDFRFFKSGAVPPFYGLRFVLDGKPVEGHCSLDGNLYHDVSRFYPLQIGSPGQPGKK